MSKSLIFSSQLVKLVSKIENGLARGIGCAMYVGGQVTFGGIDLSLHLLLVGYLWIEG